VNNDIDRFDVQCCSKNILGQPTIIDLIDKFDGNDVKNRTSIVFNDNDDDDSVVDDDEDEDNQYV
jgi:hypothetical protein